MYHASLREVSERRSTQPFIVRQSLMKVFLSWSGNRSLRVAELLHRWIPCVIQAADPWISSNNLDRGSVWFSEIYDQLRNSAVGIICITGDNKDKPWILFEAGALAKGLGSTRPCTFLVDLQPEDIDGPLAQLNHTLPTRESVLSLVRTINNAVGERALAADVLQRVFDQFWPQFETDFNRVLGEHLPESVSQPRNDRDLLVEILENTRSLNLLVRRLEQDRESTRDATDPLGASMKESLARMFADKLHSGLIGAGRSPTGSPVLPSDDNDEAFQRLRSDFLAWSKLHGGQEA